MPKMKTHKGAAKRFKATGTGKLRRGRINKNHLAEAKSPKRKRKARLAGQVAPADAPSVRRQLGL